MWPKRNCRKETMSYLDACHELDDLGGGRFRHIANLRPIAYLNSGNYARIVNDFVNGDASFPHVVTAAPMLFYVASDGMRRICPTCDPNKYIEIGAPYIKPASSWNKVNLNAFTRSGNLLTSVNPNLDVRIAMAGHFCKLEAQLKNGYLPPNNQVAFPVGMAGLTRSGTTFYDGAAPVMSIQKPVVYDAANRLDVRPITYSLVQVSNQWYLQCTLPSLTGMSAPVIDPTLTKQPDGTEGLDTFLYAGYATNYGTADTGYVGESGAVGRLLIKFDLSTLAGTETITSTTLSLYCTAEYSNNARAMQIYRQQKAWTEGGATWFKYTASNDWTTAGGFDAADCEQTGIGSRNFSATEATNAFKDWSLTGANKAAIDLGNGWLVKVDTESADQYAFALSDHATAANRPKLVIEYTTGATGCPKQFMHYARLRNN